MEPGADRGPKTRGRIIEAALGLIADRGMGGVSMTAIAESAGVARQTLYNHFPDLDSIVAVSVAEHQAASLNALRTVLATIEAPEARLEHLVRQFAAAAAHHHDPAGIAYGLSPEVRSTLEKYNTAILGVISDTLRSGIDEGEFRPDLDAGRDAYLVKRVLDAAGELAAADPDGLHAVVATATRTVLAAVGVARSTEH
jgi:AcrR family transcriptional regulator